jgi:uncharacterized protein YqiB (DUF1249 family)
MQITKTRNSTPQYKYVNQNCLSIQHEDNYQLLRHILPAKLVEGYQLTSHLKDKPELVIRVKNIYKYTIEMEINYIFKFGKSETIALKMYQDAQVAEMVYCTNLQQFIRLMGPKISPKIHMQTRFALNNFLNKWLNYLLQNGYSKDNWHSEPLTI